MATQWHCHVMSSDKNHCDKRWIILASNMVAVIKEYVMTNDNFMTISGHVTIPWQCYVLHDKNHLDIAWLLRQNGKISYHQIVINPGASVSSNSSLSNKIS